ncbi:MAG: glycosyltransferase [Alphaproteobacteria bacterium]|nr:glycosyltransferase [Alphaproteobacteria bacterium]
MVPGGGLSRVTAWILSTICLIAWIYLALGRGFFWLVRARDDDAQFAEPGTWPSVVAVVPARNEADVIRASISSLLAQDYPGNFRIVVVDDESTDGTSDAVRALEPSARIELVAGVPRPAGWVGKTWAMNQGLGRVGPEPPDYVWLTDADIAHAPETLRRLVLRAEARGLVLVSLMARLSMRTIAERALIPAFVFFFAMLFPFDEVNRPRSRIAAAAGGCMLAKAGALARAGGIATIRSEIIDDCALARVMKQQGPVWLGLTLRSRSIRGYESAGEIGRMVSRSAFAQLGYSPAMLVLALHGMLIVYAAPPLLALFAGGMPRLAGWICWIGMAAIFAPTLRYYRLSPLWGLVLPLTGALYALFTLQSALQFWRGRGGMWKGRAQAARPA